MKELSIEQKAKAYDEALERARAKYAMKDQPIHQDLVDIFPELAESEDEGIYRKLIAFLKQCKAVYGDNFTQFGLNIDDALAWLEKQGEKEEFIKKELERIRGYRDEAIRRLNELEQQGEQKHQYNSRPKYIGEEELLGEQKPAEWSEEDEEISEAIIKRIKGESEALSVSLSSAISWVGNIKDRVQLQSQWKPSDEQIKALNYVINLMASSESSKENDYYYNVFKGLREQLKKL